MILSSLHMTRREACSLFRHKFSFLSFTRYCRSIYDHHTQNRNNTPKVLNKLASELGPVFAHLFQQSIDSGEIPKEWSLAICCNICPLFKKADRSLACNYHPVSLTCVPCKLLEHIVCSNIMSHLDHHKLLSDRQHAFRKSHSCETQLATVIDDWAKILDNQGQVDTCILDFEKAFDTPPHELLKSKLFSYGIGGKTIKWIDAFLCCCG